MAKKSQADWLIVYKRLLVLVKPYWYWFVLGIIGSLMLSGVDSLFAWLLKPIINKVFIAKDTMLVRFMPILIIILIVIRGCSTLMSSYFINRVARRVVYDMRCMVFRHLVALPMSFYNKHDKPSLISLMIYNIEQVSSSCSATLVKAIQDLSLVFGLIAVMFVVSWQLAAFILIAAPTVAIVINIASKRTRRLSHRVQDSVGSLARVTQESVYSIKDMRIYGAIEHSARRYAAAADENQRQSMKVVVTNSVSGSLVQVFLSIPVALVLFVVTQSWLQISAGAFVSVFTAMTMLLQPLRRLASANAEVQRGVVGAKSVFEVLDSPLESDLGAESIAVARGDWEISNLSFAYDGQDAVALHDLSFSVNAGMSVAIVGVSGSGKTTLMNILARFYEATSGSILLDGCNVAEYKLDDYRNQFAYVGQDPVIFNSTLAENVVYAESMDEQRVWDCLRSAQLDTWVREQPLQLQTIVGEEGNQLSGGQKQRLAIARALYRHAPVVLLDEATSAMDYETERKVQRAIMALSKDSTMFVIAHRLSTIINADLILVLDQGRLVEQGRHEDLLASRGRYADLYNMQFNTEQEVVDA